MNLFSVLKGFYIYPLLSYLTLGKYMLEHVSLINFFYIIMRLFLFLPSFYLKGLNQMCFFYEGRHYERLRTRVGKSTYVRLKLQITWRPSTPLDALYV
jgi:hypothetical protein